MIITLCHAGGTKQKSQKKKNTLNVKADKIYVAKSHPKPIEKTEVPKLKILGFSTICYSREGSPKPDRNPVIIISTATNSGEEKLFLANEDKDDKPALRSFHKLRAKIRPRCNCRLWLELATVVLP